MDCDLQITAMFYSVIWVVTSQAHNNYQRDHMVSQPKQSKSELPAAMIIPSQNYCFVYFACI